MLQKQDDDDEEDNSLTAACRELQAAGLMDYRLQSCGICNSD